MNCTPRVPRQVPCSSWARPAHSRSLGPSPAWGERERGFWTIRAGWREGALVIDSRRHLTRGRETMRLERGGRRLRMDASVETGDRDVRSVSVCDRR